MGEAQEAMEIEGIWMKEGGIAEKRNITGRDKRVWRALKREDMLMKDEGSAEQIEKIWVGTESFR